MSSRAAIAAGRGSEPTRRGASIGVTNVVIDDTPGGGAKRRLCQPCVVAACAAFFFVVAVGLAVAFPTFVYTHTSTTTTGGGKEDDAASKKYDRLKLPAHYQKYFMWYKYAQFPISRLYPPYYFVAECDSITKLNENNVTTYDVDSSGRLSVEHTRKIKNYNIRDNTTVTDTEYYDVARPVAPNWWLSGAGIDADGNPIGWWMENNLDNPLRVAGFFNNSVDLVRCTSASTEYYLSPSGTSLISLTRETFLPCHFEPKKLILEFEYSLVRGYDKIYHDSTFPATIAVFQEILLKEVGSLMFKSQDPYAQWIVDNHFAQHNDGTGLFSSYEEMVRVMGTVGSLVMTSPTSWRYANRCGSGPIPPFFGAVCSMSGDDTLPHIPICTRDAARVRRVHFPPTRTHREAVVLRAERRRGGVENGNIFFARVDSHRTSFFFQALSPPTRPHATGRCRHGHGLSPHERAHTAPRPSSRGAGTAVKNASPKRTTDTEMEDCHLLALRARLSEIRASVGGMRHLDASVRLRRCVRRLEAAAVARALRTWVDWRAHATRNEGQARLRAQLGGLLRGERDVRTIAQRVKLQGCVVLSLHVGLSRAFARWTAAAAAQTASRAFLRTAWREWTWCAAVVPYVRVCLRLREKVEHYRSLSTSLKVEVAQAEFERLRK